MKLTIDDIGGFMRSSLDLSRLPNIEIEGDSLIECGVSLFENRNFISLRDIKSAMFFHRLWFSD